jgi:hypothetical protein
MIASILTGLAGIIAASLCSALLLFAHFTGRLRRPAALAIAAGALTVGAALSVAGSMDGFVLGHVAQPIGVALMLAAAISGLLTYQAGNSGRAAIRPGPGARDDWRRVWAETRLRRR